MDDFHEAMIKLQRAAEESKNAITSMVDAWIQAVSEVFDAMADMIEKIKSCLARGERPKWHMPQPQRIRPLLLDRRSKVHRCRNCC